MPSTTANTSRGSDETIAIPSASGESATEGGEVD